MAEKAAINEPEKTLIAWMAKSRPYNPDQEKTRSVLVVLGALITLVLVFAGEWMLLIVLAAGAFYYYAQNRTPPNEVEFSITNKGVKAFGRLYLWWEFRRWWMGQKGLTKLLILELNTGVMGRMFVPLENVKSTDVERVLKDYLLNEEPQETPVDRMTKWVAEKFPLENKI